MLVEYIKRLDGAAHHDAHIVVVGSMKALLINIIQQQKRKCSADPRANQIPPNPKAVNRGTTPFFNLI